MPRTTAAQNPEPAQPECPPPSPRTLRPHRAVRSARQERGTVLVEFAIVLPVLLLVILGIIDFGRFFNYSDQESQLAAQAARWAAVNYAAPNQQSLQNYVASQAMGGLQSSGGDVTSPAQVYIYYPTGSSNAVGNPVRACVVASVQLLPMLGGGSLQLTESATMRLEQPATNWTSDVSTTVPPACPTS